MSITPDKDPRKTRLTKLLDGLEVALINHINSWKDPEIEAEAFIALLHDRGDFGLELSLRQHLTNIRRAQEK